MSEEPNDTGGTASEDIEVVASVAGEQDSPASTLESQARLGLAPVHKVLVRVKAVLGQTKVNVGDLLRLRSGDVIDLDRRVGEPVDVWVNNRLIARGEVVLTGGLLGVALTEMVKQAR